MEREFLATGKTVEEAIEAAYEKAGVDREYVTVELLERPKKKFFGLKTIPAQAKATIDEDYFKKMFAPAKEKKEEPRKKKEVKPAPEKTEKVEKAEKPQKPSQPKQEKPKKEQKPQQPKQEKPVKEPKPVQEKPVAPVVEKAEKPAASEESLNAKGEEAAKYIKEVLTALGYPEAEVASSVKDGMIVLQLSGEEMGAVVGRRGDNLDAMQYLASLVANRSEGSYVRVVLDVDDYRSKREASLRAYARKTATNAVRSGRSITLEPMNPYERRIVHSTVQTVNGATSKSVGSEPNRKVVISPIEGAKPRSERFEKGEHSFERTERNDRKGRNSDRRGRGGKGNDRRESQKVIVAPSNEPPKNDVSGISLYGKIEL